MQIYCSCLYSKCLTSRCLTRPKRQRNLNSARKPRIAPQEGFENAFYLDRPTASFQEILDKKNQKDLEKTQATGLGSCVAGGVRKGSWLYGSRCAKKFLQAQDKQTLADWEKPLASLGEDSAVHLTLTDVFGFGVEDAATIFIWRFPTFRSWRRRRLMNA